MRVTRHRGRTLARLECGVEPRASDEVPPAGAVGACRGNLDITGDRYGVPRYDHLAELIDAVRARIRQPRA